MRKFLALMVVCCFAISCVAFAEEDYSTYTKDELLQKRNQLIQELSAVTTAYGSAAKAELLTPSDESLGSIISIFPDEQFAMLVRDKCGKFSINQPITRAELDTITSLRLADDYTPSDLTGIGHLRNVTAIHLFGNKLVTVIPEEIGNLTKLEHIDLFGCKITSLPASLFTISTLKHLELPQTGVSVLPEEVGNLLLLKELLIDSTSITKLPDSICNLTNLQTLNISNTKISELPSSIGNLVSLKNLDISNTRISTLPDSIWGLELEKLNMSGTSIR